LIEFFEDGRLELFHLATDPGESKNLVRREAKRAAVMHQQLKDWRASVGAVMPKANPGYDPARSDMGLLGAQTATPPL
jgi:arylsulfatase A